VRAGPTAISAADQVAVVEHVRARVRNVCGGGCRRDAAAHVPLRQVQLGQLDAAGEHLREIGHLANIPRAHGGQGQKLGVVQEHLLHGREARSVPAARPAHLTQLTALREHALEARGLAHVQIAQVLYARQLIAALEQALEHFRSFERARCSGQDEARNVHKRHGLVVVEPLIYISNAHVRACCEYDLAHVGTSVAALDDVQPRLLHRARGNARAVTVASAAEPALVRGFRNRGGSVVAAIAERRSDGQGVRRCVVAPPHVVVAREASADIAVAPAIGVRARVVGEVAGAVVRYAAHLAARVRIARHQVDARAEPRVHHAAVGARPTAERRKTRVVEDVAVEEARAHEGHAVVHLQQAHIAGVFQHVRHRGSALHVPAVQIQLGHEARALEGAREVIAIGYVPSANVVDVLQAGVALEHGAEVRDVARIPVVDFGQAHEDRATLEEGAQVRDLRHVPALHAVDAAQLSAALEEARERALRSGLAHVEPRAIEGGHHRIALEPRFGVAGNDAHIVGCGVVAVVVITVGTREDHLLHQTVAVLNYIQPRQLIVGRCRILLGNLGHHASGFGIGRASGQRNADGKRARSGVELPPRIVVALEAPGFQARRPYVHEATRRITRGGRACRVARGEVFARAEPQRVFGLPRTNGRAMAEIVAVVEGGPRQDDAIGERDGAQALGAVEHVGARGAGGHCPAIQVDGSQIGEVVEQLGKA